MAATTQQYADAARAAFTADNLRAQLLQESPLTAFDFSPEAYARRAWVKAVAHLEAREAAREEWPFPW